jgi:peroxisomal enoyl-CoA hydratase 2
LYEKHPKFEAFPTYPLQLAFRGTETDVIDFYAKSNATYPPTLPPLDTRRVLDGERSIQMLKPIPRTSQGRNFELRQHCVGAYDKGKPGLVLETETQLIDADSNEVYTIMRGSGFYVGQGGFGGPKVRNVQHTI